MEHEHSHNHAHGGNSKALLIVLVITALYMIAEFAGGLYSNSLALLADAGHMLGDVAALALSYFAIWLSTKKSSPQKTFGYLRAEIFAALINGVSLVVISFFIIHEAYLRMVSPPEVKSFVMIIVATGGLIVNIIGATILHKGSKENLNIKGAFLHILGDLLGSIGAILAGVLIYFWQIYISDPIISIVIALLVLYSAGKLTNSAVHILMESAPVHIDIDKVEDSIKNVEGVINVHDLHVWNIDSKNISLSVHIVAENIHCERILTEINSILQNDFHICHSTIQIEPKGFHEPNCPFCE